MQIKRLYENIIESHFSQLSQMLFLAGPRQVGKTTLARNSKDGEPATHYLNWDDLSVREMILTNQVADVLSLKSWVAGQAKITVIFDELHKNPQWKQFIKGFYDLYKDKVNVIVTGSAKLNVYRKGGDSLMGRYFLTRVHPLSVRELIDPSLPGDIISTSQQIENDVFANLLQYGGFPDPFIQKNSRFSNNWQQLRYQQLFREDIRDLSHVQEVAQLEMLAMLVKLNASKQVNLSKLAAHLQVAATTVKRWLAILADFYFSFTIQPWHKNVIRSLKKEPKVYLYDWSEIADKGARHENFIASHLLKAVHFWTDYGFGQFELHYLRDLQKREVDFVVSKDGVPWMLVEVKSSHKESISSSLHYFQKLTGAPHAFQVVFDLDYQSINCFDYYEPVIVSAKTFLSQLV